MITDGIGPTEIIDGMPISAENVIADGKSPNLGIIIGAGVNSNGTGCGAGQFKLGKVGIAGIGIVRATGAGTGKRVFNSVGLGSALSTPEITMLQFSLLTVKTGSTAKFAG